MLSFERVLKYIDLPNEFVGENAEIVDQKWPSKGEIKFQNVEARYPNGHKPVLTKIDLDISSGQKIGVVGRTGSGK